MRDMTHNGSIGTDDIGSDGYVWYRCDVYNLPDNTAGKIGYHVIYRPLCRPDYKGTEVVTDQMMDDTREHYRIVRDAAEIERKAQFERDLAEISKPVKQSAMSKVMCPHCATVCYGDCQS